MIASYRLCHKSFTLVCKIRKRRVAQQIYLGAFVAFSRCDSRRCLYHGEFKGNVRGPCAMRRSHFQILHLPGMCNKRQQAPCRQKLNTSTGNRITAHLLAKWVEEVKGVTIGLPWRLLPFCWKYISKPYKHRTSSKVEMP